MENNRFEEVFSKCHNSFISQRNSKTKKGFSIYRPRAIKWDQIQDSSSIRLEMATDQRIIFGIHLVKMRLLHAITKEGVFLKNGYTDYFFYFRIGFPMQNTAGNCWDTLSTMKMKLAATERKCAWLSDYFTWGLKSSSFAFTKVFIARSGLPIDDEVPLSRCVVQSQTERVVGTGEVKEIQNLMILEPLHVYKGWTLHNKQRKASNDVIGDFDKEMVRKGGIRACLYAEVYWIGLSC